MHENSETKPMTDPRQRWTVSGYRPGGAEGRFCDVCQEELLIETAGSCPQCGKSFDPDDPTTWKTARDFLWSRYLTPGLALVFLLAVACGVIGYLYLLDTQNVGATGFLGVAAFLVLPASIGALVGYLVRMPRLSVGVGCVVLLSTGVLLITLGASGLFCGVVGILFLCGPLLVGVGCGALLRRWLRTTSWDHRGFLPVLALIAVPYAAAELESAFRGEPEVAVVETRAAFPSASAAWRSIVFYEDVRHDAPWLLRLSLPRPVRSVGRKDRPGSVVLCHYEDGFLAKRIVEVVPEKTLRFRVIAQKLHFERDVTLLGGAFTIEEQADGSAIVVLTTRYRRRLYPSWMWEPTEHAVIRALHEHVLMGMRREASRLARQNGVSPTRTKS